MISALINLLIWILVLGLVYWVVTYALDAIPIPEPANRIVKVVLAVIIALVLLTFLLNLLGVSTGINVPKIG